MYIMYKYIFLLSSSFTLLKVWNLKNPHTFLTMLFYFFTAYPNVRIEVKKYGREILSQYILYK